MRLLRFVLLTAVFSVLLGANQEASGLRDYLSELIRKAAVKAGDRKLEIDQDKFKGSIEAVEPSRNIKVDVSEFKLDNDKFTATVKLNGRLKIKGRLTQDSATLDVDVDADVEMTTSVEAKVTEEKGEFFIDPHVKSLSAHVAIQKIKPEELKDGKELLSRLANKAYEYNRDRILEDLNKSVTKTKIKL